MDVPADRSTRMAAQRGPRLECSGGRAVGAIRGGTAAATPLTDRRGRLADGRAVLVVDDCAPLAGPLRPAVEVTTRSARGGQAPRQPAACTRRPRVDADTGAHGRGGIREPTGRWSRWQRA